MRSDVSDYHSLLRAQHKQQERVSLAEMQENGHFLLGTGIHHYLIGNPSRGFFPIWSLAASS
jgi:hypothetical protein